MQIYYAQDFVTINYDQDNHIIIVKWLVAPTSVELREGSNMVITAMEHFKTGKVIWDTNFLGAISLEDQQWGATEFHNNFMKAGAPCTVFIIPPYIFTQMSVEDTMSQVNEKDLPSAYFDTMEAAIDWIKQF